MDDIGPKRVSASSRPQDAVEQRQALQEERFEERQDLREERLKRLGG